MAEERQGLQDRHGIRKNGRDDRLESGLPTRLCSLRNLLRRPLLTLVVTVLTDKILGAVCVVLVISRRDGICIQKNIAMVVFVRSKRL